MRRRGSAAVLAFGVLWLTAACLDIASPVTGIAAITTVLAPIPSVSVGESSQDTLGAPQALRVVAFGPNGDTVRDAKVVFFAVDSTHKLRVDSTTGVTHGDSLSPNAAIVARVTPASGKGSIRTLVVPYPVVPVPIKASKDSDVKLFTIVASSVNNATDTLSTALLSPPLSVTVAGEAGAVVPKYLVSFELVRTLRAKPGVNQPTVVLTEETGRASSVDTTDALGHGSRRLRVRLSAVEASLLGGVPDTAIVRAHVRHNGTDLVIPADSFIVPITVTVAR